jgi:hypothetical protein
MSFPALDGLWQRPHRGRPRASRGWIIAAVAGSAVIGGAVSAYGASSSRRAGRLTPAERHYMQQQQQREEEAYRFQQLMTPFMLEDMGLDAEYDASGQITRLKRRAKTPQEARQEEIIGLAQEKVLKGLKGELDVDPQTERALAKNMALKKEQVRRAYGPGGDLGTGAQNTLNLAEQSGNALRESVRRGEMGNAEAMARANIAQQSQDEQWRNQVARGLPFDSMRMIQSSTPWDSYTAGAGRLAAQQDAAFYARLGGIIGGMGSMAGGMGGGAGGAGAAGASGGGGFTGDGFGWGDYL